MRQVHLHPAHGAARSEFVCEPQKPCTFSAGFIACFWVGGKRSCGQRPPFLRLHLFHLREQQEMGATALPRAHKCHLRSAKRLRARDALSSVSALAPTRRHVVLTPVQPILFLFKHRCPPHVLTDKGGRAFVSSVLQRSVHVYSLIYPLPLAFRAGLLVMGAGSP